MKRERASCPLINVVRNNSLFENKMHLFGSISSVFKRTSIPKLSNVNCVKQASDDEDPPVCATDFRTIKVIGKGGFGEVHLVEKGGKLYAMKKVKKSLISGLGFVDKIMVERDLLVANLMGKKSPWIVELFYTFQDKHFLYFILEYCPGGDLFYLLERYRIFDEATARFYIAELVLAVEQIHKLDFIHRDLKFDNILIGKDGHIKLTDFGLSKRIVRLEDLFEDPKYHKKTARDTDISIGTLEFMAPEIISGKRYTESCDLWSIGVLLYEMLAGKNPFFCPDSIETMKRIQRWWELKMPPRISPEAIDLIKRLLCGEGIRLNLDGIKAHAFFRDFDWEKLKNREIVPPFIPKLLSTTDTSCFDEQETGSNSIAPQLRPHIKRKPRKADFARFNFFGLQSA